MRRVLAALAASLMVVAVLVSRTEEPAVATPVATSEEAYQLMGRAFPDPHGCFTPTTPGKSPWAKGNVCAFQYLQWDDTIAGLEFLE